MLAIETTLKESVINGLGVFTTSPVSAGAVVWRFNGHIDTIIPAQVVPYLPYHVIKFINKYAYRNSELDYCIGVDNDRFINHSKTPNVGEAADGTRVALYDLLEGEELTEDYTVNYPNSCLALTGTFADGSTAR